MPVRYLWTMFIVLFVAPWSMAHGDEQARPAGATDDQIAGLIRQLGNDDYKTREAASKALEKIGRPALDALRRSAKTDSDLEVRHRAAAAMLAIENSLDLLLADYRSYGLPLPPDQARLVEFELRPADKWEISDGHTTVWAQYPPTMAAGFMLEPAKASAPAKLLLGLDVHSRADKQVGHEFDPRKFTVDYIEGKLAPESSLAYAMQLHARGWPSAQIVFDHCFASNDHRPRRTILRLMAWEYWNNQLLEPTTDHWPTACRHMKALIADMPELNSPTNRRLLESLEASIVPSKAKPGSIEAMVDGLLNVNLESGRWDHAEDMMRQISERGFDAVPILLDHLDDPRLTHIRVAPQALGVAPFPDGHPCHLRVGEITRAIFNQVAARSQMLEWPAKDGDSARIKQIASDWWEKAREQGEEAYLLAAFRAICEAPLGTRLGRVDSGPPPYSEGDCLHLLGKKHPQALARLYRDNLNNDPSTESWGLAKAIANSALTRDEKVELLVRAAKHHDLNHRDNALWRLKDIDSQQVVAPLIATLDELPREGDGSNSRFAGVRIVPLVCATDDPRVWQSFSKLAKRAEVNVRTRLLGELSSQNLTPTRRRLAVTLLSDFLADKDVSEDSAYLTSRVLGGGEAAMERLEICDLAAFAALKLVGTKEEPSPYWTDDDWAKLRDRAREAVKKELASKDKQ